MHWHFLAVGFVIDTPSMMYVGLHSICMLTSMELVLMPRCSRLHLHTNVVNSKKKQLYIIVRH